MKTLQRLCPLSLASVAVAVGLAAHCAHAADNGLYFGAAFGDQSADFDWRVNPVDIQTINEANGLKIIAGLRPLEPLAIELNYVDLGRSGATLSLACPAVVGAVCPNPDRGVDASALSVSAIALFAAGPIDIFGRAGLARWQSESSGSLGFAASASGTDATFGFGAQVRIRSFALRLERERFDVAQGSIDVASIGFTYTFF